MSNALSIAFFEFGPAGKSIFGSQSHGCSRVTEMESKRRKSRRVCRKNLDQPPKQKESSQGLYIDKHPDYKNEEERIRAW
jgi:hypothetical protein